MQHMFFQQCFYILESCSAFSFASRVQKEKLHKDIQETQTS